MRIKQGQGEVLLLTIVPRRATLDPAVRVLASTTLPKEPSPISLTTSKRSSSVVTPCDVPLREYS